MRAWRRLFVAALALGLGAAAACGLDVAGTLDVAEGGAPDGVAPAPPPPPEGIDASQTCDGSACGIAVPMGWAVVTFGARTNPCGAGFAANDVFESPAADAGACSCGACAVTAQPSCMNGSSAPKVDFGGTPTCDITSPVSFPANGGACSPQTFPAKPSHMLVNAPPPTGGGCDAGATAQRAAVGTTDERVCVPPTCASACNQPGVKTCLLASGDQPCPAGTTDRHVVGTDFAVTCAACACAITGTCEGTTTLYSDNACKTKFAQVDSGTCTAIPNMDTASYEWLGNPHNVACNVTAGTTDASVALVGATTICCP
jgi:hypothetical protein